ncbi:MAG: ATP-binding protein [Sulfuricellaceae bacterium]|jgi:anti-sigma regulatory factor (Ser/Thr protein kinase)
MKQRRPRLDIEIGNDFAELPRLHAAARDFLQAAQVDEMTRFAVLFALEELVSNIIRYAYDDQFRHPIQVHFEQAAGSIEVEVVDDGRPFNPCPHPPPDTGLPPEKRPVGGLGIFLARELTQEMHYQRENNLNRVRLSFSGLAR